MTSRTHNAARKIEQEVWQFWAFCHANSILLSLLRRKSKAKQVKSARVLIVDFFSTVEWSYIAYTIERCCSHVISSTSKPSSSMNVPPIPAVIQTDSNQEPEEATHFPSMASSPTTASENLPPYFRVNYLPSIPASLIFLSFLLHIYSSSFSIPSPPSKRCRTLIHLTLLCSAYSRDGGGFW